MAKPILSPISVFDATRGTNARLKTPSNKDINISYKYEYEIYSNYLDAAENKNVSVKIATGSGTCTDFNAAYGYVYHITPTDNLMNRSLSYYIQVRIKAPNENNYGEWSDVVVFWCKERPTLGFEDMNPTIVNDITTSTSLFSLTYTHKIEQGETLSSYQYHLYDSKKNLISESSMYYGSIVNSYNVSGLENLSSFFVRGTGTTKSGYSLDTGYVAFRTVYYTDAESTAYVQCRNYPCDGYITIASHLVDSSGYSTDTIKYISSGDGDYAADLTNGEKIMFDIPYQIDFYNTQDYTLKFKVKPVIRKNFATLLLDQDGFIYNAYLSTNVRAFTNYYPSKSDTADKNPQFYVMLKVVHEDSGYAASNIYYIHSNFLTYYDNMGYIMIVLVHKDGAYELRIEEVVSA